MKVIAPQGKYQHKERANTSIPLSINLFELVEIESLGDEYPEPQNRRPKPVKRIDLFWYSYR